MEKVFFDVQTTSVFSRKFLEVILDLKAQLYCINYKRKYYYYTFTVSENLMELLEPTEKGNSDVSGSTKRKETHAMSRLGEQEK